MNQSLKFSFKTKLIFGFSVIILAVIASVFIAIYSLNLLVRVNQDLDESYRITRELVRLRADNTRVRTLLLEVIDPEITDWHDHMQEIEDLLVTIQEEFDYLGIYLEGDRVAQTSFREIVAMAAESESIRRKQIELLMSGQHAEAARLFRGLSYQLYEEIHQKIINLGSYLDGQNDILQSHANQVAIRSNTLLTMIGFCVIIVTFIVAMSMIRMVTRVSRDIKEGVAILGNSTSEIQTTVAEISTGATETATAISETSTTVEEIRQTAMVASNKAKSLMHSSQKASDVGEKGFESSRKMVLAMNKIEAQMKTIHNTITKLSEQNRSIGEITSTVSDIADQSNLLAVNAAIEAAKAGEHGRGFTVVAQEIRSLAEQSKRSTAQVKDILNDIQKSVLRAVDVINQGTETVDEGSELVKEDRVVVEMLLDSINEAMDAAVQISSSSQQQMAGMDQIVPAMENIKQASEQNVVGIKQTQEAAGSLFVLGQSLKKIIERYRL